jgi:hypothetical protein
LGALEASSPTPFLVARRRRRMPSQHQTSLARCAASLALGWRFLWLGHSRLRLWAAWDSGRSVPRPWARSKRALPLPLVARRRRRMPSQHQTSLARCAASLALGWRFLYLGHSRLRLWAAWDSGRSVPRPWARSKRALPLPLVARRLPFVEKRRERRGAFP